MNQETRLGLFLLAAVGAILASAVFLGNVRLFQRTDRYHLDFADVEALPPKAAVKIAGVEIGKVHKIQLVNGRARVIIEIDPAIQLHSDAVARIGSTGIIGTRFVELLPGTVKAPVLEPGSTIRGLDGGSINQMFNKLTSLFEEDEEYGNAIDNLKATLANVRHASAALSRALGDHAEDLEKIVENVRDLTQSGKVFVAHLEEISTEHQEDVKIAIAKFREVGEKLDALLTKVSRGEGTIGALVTDDKAGQEVKEAITSITETATSAKKVIGRFTMINTYWNYRYRYDTRDEDGRSDLGITFVPRPGKYYAIGVTNVGEPIDNEKHEAFERKNRITAVIGADYGPFTGYAGAVRSRGGGGLNFRPFWFSKRWGRRIELTSEASDFSRDRVVKGEILDRAFVAAGGHIALTRWLWVGGRWEDLLERSAFQAYANVIFRDEDLAYLLGFASIAR